MYTEIKYTLGTPDLFSLLCIITYNASPSETGILAIERTLGYKSVGTICLGCTKSFTGNARRRELRGQGLRLCSRTLSFLLVCFLGRNRHSSKAFLWDEPWVQSQVPPLPHARSVALGKLSNHAGL